MEVVVLTVGQFGVSADDDGFTDVGADVCDAHHVREQVFVVRVEHDVALSADHAGEVVLLELADQVFDDLAQGLDAVGGQQVTLAEGQLRIGQDLVQQGLQDIQLGAGGPGERRVLFREALCIVRDVDRVITQAFEFGDDLVVLVDDIDVVFILEVRKESDEIAADLVREGVDIGLFVLDLLIDFFVIIAQNAVGADDVVLGQLQLDHEQVIATVEREGRGGEEGGTERVDLVLILVLRDGLILDDPSAELLKERQQGDQKECADDVENGIGIGDETRVECSVPDPVQQSGLVRDGDADHDDQGLAEVVEDVDDTDTLCLRLGADGTYDGGRDAVAEINADDDGIGAPPDEKSGGGEGLQDTDGGRGALQGEGDTRARQVPDQGIVADAGKEILYKG